MSKIAAADRMHHLEQTLHALYAQYNHREFIGLDPLAFVWRYTDPRDREIVGVFAALLAYGRVEQIHRSVTKLLDIMGPSPYAFVRDFKPKQARRFADFKHRFNTGEDVCRLIGVLSQIVTTSGSIEKAFLDGYQPSAPNVLAALQAFYERFTEVYRRLYGDDLTGGMKFLAPNPASTAKRWHLYLRWMVRQDAVDPGVWQSVAPAKLLIPADTHMIRLTRILGFHRAKTVSLKTVLQMTARFAQICPEDPVRYDFALSRIGILEHCTGNPQPQCRLCRLSSYCAATPG